jgi:Flp pilus assembly pilin Flp
MHLHKQNSTGGFGMKTKLNQNKKGQGLVEYVAITVLVAIVSIGTVKAFGSKIKKHMDKVTSKIDSTLTIRASASLGDDEENSNPNQGNFPFGIFQNKRR